MATGERITAAEFRALQGAPKTAVQGPAAPRDARGKPQWALGRIPIGMMNKTEARFLEEFVTPLMAVKELVWWCFEGFKLRLADNTFLTVDFSLMRANGSFELVDVKGSKAMIEDDAHAKMKIAAERFPFQFFYAWPLSKHTGWHFEQVGRVA